jgi:hypothetical protein
LLWLLLLLLVGGGAQAQTIQFTVKEIALKNGDSTELGDVYYISTNCKSMLKSTPEVEILDGPPGVAATINAAKVVPRGLGCANPVSGGKLVITAKDIRDYSYTRMVIRILGLNDFWAARESGVSSWPEPAVGPMVANESWAAGAVKAVSRQ